MRHPRLRFFSGALLLGAIALAPLQGCKRLDMAPDLAASDGPPSSPEDDGLLTELVRAALARSPLVRSGDISVQSHGGVVLLTGMAADTTQIDLAMFVAQNVPGVNLVTSFMFANGTSPEKIASKDGPHGIQVISAVAANRTAVVEPAGGRVASASAGKPIALHGRP